MAWNKETNIKGPAGADAIGGITQADADLRYVNITGDTMTGALNMPVGSGGAPSITFGGATSGVFGSATTVRISTSGSERVTIGSSFQTTVPVRTSSGTVGAPGFSFSGDTNSGFYLVADGDIRMSMNGADVVKWLDDKSTTFSGKVNLPASTTASAFLNLPLGPDPTAGTPGDLWMHTTGGLTFRWGSNNYVVVHVNGTQTISGAKTFTAKPIMTTPTTSTASINLPHGVAPTTPTNGDLWTTTAGLYGRINGVTQGPYIDATSVPASDWNTLLNKPSTFPPSAHVHPTSEVTGLDAALAGKADLAGATFTGKVVAGGPTATVAAFNITPGAGSPSSVVDGDFWMTTANFLYRVNGVSHFVANLGGTQTFTAAKTFSATANVISGKLTFNASDATNHRLNVAHSATIPASPTNGDFWSTSAGFFGRVNGVTIGPFGTAGGAGISDAPNDGQTYGRKSLGWIPLAGGGGISEAPTDGGLYARQTSTWNDLTDEFAGKAPTVHTHAQADITNLTTDLALKAPIASPTFTGTAVSPHLRIGTVDNSSAGTGLVLMKRTSGYNEAIAFSDGAGGLRGGIAMTPAGAMTLRIGDNTNDDVTISSTGGITTSGGIAALNVVLTGASSIKTADSTTALLVAGATKGVRFVPSANFFAIEGVDQTGVGSYQPLRFFGSSISLAAKTTANGGSAAGAAFNILPAAAPTTPVNGDLWTTTTGLFTQVNGATVGPLSGATDISGKADLVHTHAQADVTNLVTDLAGKAPTVHTHTTADVTGLDTALTGKVAKVGDTMTGDLTIAKTSPSFSLEKTVGQLGTIFFKTGTSARWGIDTLNNAESGSNVGSDLRINRYSDAGSYIDTPVTIGRSTGNLAFKGDVVISKTAPIMSLDKTAANEGALYFRTGTSLRWKILSDNSAESAGNGSHFTISRHDDAGTLLNNPIQIDRSTGRITFNSTASGIVCNGTGAIYAGGGIQSAFATAIPAGGAAAASLKATSATNFGVFFGSGVPTLSAAQGSIYLRSDGVNGARTYVNTNGTTGWDALTDATTTASKEPLLPAGGTTLTFLRGDKTWAVPTGDGSTADTRNRIVNSAMQISQERGVSNPVTTTLAYALDQWRLDFTVPSMAQAAQIAYVTLNGSKYVLNANVATAKPSLAIGDFLTLTTPIEGIRVADFAYGTASARQAVLRFSVSSGVAGTYTVAVRNGAVDRTWLGTFSIAAGEVSTLVTRTLVIPGDTTGTWLKDSGAGLIVSVCYACGTSLHGTAGWQAGNKLGIAGMANAASITGWHIMLADVGLYLDPLNSGIAPLWQMPDEAEELRACQRYYSQQASSAQSPVAGSMITPVYFPAPMRATPAITNVAAGALSNASGPVDAASSNQAGYFQFSSTAAGGYVLGRINAYSARL